jgi:hypothetical protein
MKKFFVSEEKKFYRIGYWSEVFKLVFWDLRVHFLDSLDKVKWKNFFTYRYLYPITAIADDFESLSLLLTALKLL